MKKICYAISFFMMAIHTIIVAKETMHPILVKDPNQKIEIALKGNPSTGYQWFLQPYPKELELKDYSYKSDNSNRVGAGGMQVWTFKLESDDIESPQVLQVTFSYDRAWEGKSVDTFQQLIYLFPENN